MQLPLATILALMVWAGPPLTQVPPAPLIAEGPPITEPAAPADGVKAEAARAFAEGEALFAERRYDDAALAFAEADALVSHPDTLYNLALSLEMAGDMPGAWMAYRRALRADPDRPRDMSRRLAKLTPRVGVVEFHSPARAICIDGEPMVETHSGTYELAVEPGSHQLYVDGAEVEIEAIQGSTRVLYLDRAELLNQDEDPRPRRAVNALTGISIGAALAATGLGVAAMFVGPPQQRGLLIGATASAGTAAGLSIAALVAHRAAKRRARHRLQLAPVEGNEPTFSCSTD